jgi:prepilin-type N-terminal cleavage/methylation domain-containing protein
LIVNCKLIVVNSKKGFTLIESLLAIGIFAVISFGIYFSYSNLIDAIIASQSRMAALAVIDNEMEVIRNMAYWDVGTVGGSPAGILLPERNVKVGGGFYKLRTYVRNIDDPYDGTAPDDSSPADYKLVEMDLTCEGCLRLADINATTIVAPVGLENQSDNGSLVIYSIDSSGAPLAGANISITNTHVIPAINITDVTDSAGVYRLIDTATSSAGYEIRVTKAGYSSDRTYAPGEITNPHPTKPNATVASLQTTEISFSIDRTSSLELRTSDKFCAPIGNVTYSITGSKIIGINPDIYKYSTTSLTNSAGIKNISGLEWDAYSILNTDSRYHIAGSPVAPFIVDPAQNYSLRWILEPAAPNAVLVKVIDQNGNAINDANVALTKTSYSETKISGKRFFSETNWSGSNYSYKSDRIDVDSSAGDIIISQIDGKYATSSQELISNTLDLGTSNTVFFEFNWNPSSQPPQTGEGSLVFQVATNNDNSTWAFTGPDGTADSFYTVSGGQIHSINNGKRYLRYKVIMKTARDDFSPSVSDISIGFRSDCGVGGQAFFNGLATGTYELTVSKTGYNTYVDDMVSVSDDWREYHVVLGSL